MSAAEEQRKADYLQTVEQALLAQKASRELIEFSRMLYERVPTTELVGMAAAVRAQIAHSFFEFVQEKSADEPKLRVFNPSDESHGWSSHHTIIEIVNNDGPFLVDSVVLALSAMGISAQLIVHPVMFVERDNKGRISSLQREGGARVKAESLMHVEVDFQRQAPQLERIEKAIRAGLDELHYAVRDWKPMVAAAREIASELSSTHADMSPDEVEELSAFLNWLADDHFTFLGYREYVISDQGADRVLRSVGESGLGIMHADRREAPVRSLKDLARGADQRNRSEPIIITKTNALSRVHRQGYMDYISVLYFGADGRVCQEKRIIGLFTSGAYTRRCQDTPLVRRKAAHVMAQSGLRPSSHAAKALLHILETLPREELFQATTVELLDLGIGVLDLQERSQTRLFIRRERFGRFFSCLVFIPRERFNTENRLKIQNILKRALKGQTIDFAVQVGESNLARVHVVVRPKEYSAIDVDIEKIEQKIKVAIRRWDDELEEVLVKTHGADQGGTWAKRFAGAFPAAYVEDVAPSVAQFDVVNMAKILDSDQVALSLYRPKTRDTSILRFKIFKRLEPIPLSDVLPMLENLGTRIVSERPYELKLADGQMLWIQDFDMRPPEGFDYKLELIREQFQEAFEQVWRKQAENDGFNRLVLLARLTWRQVALLRAISKYLLQSEMPYSQQYMEQTLNSFPLIARLLVEYFESRFDPDRLSENKKQKLNAHKSLHGHFSSLAQSIEDPVLTEYLEEVCQARGEEGSGELSDLMRRAIGRALQSVQSADQDRILRGFCQFIDATLRTSLYQIDDAGEPKSYVSFKLDSAVLQELPKPKPFREIWVYSPRVEGIHLRGGSVARGGLRWSDRREDFRTEVLGLLRAQMVKNTMIVPVGAKGGFVAKQLPDADDRTAFLEEGIGAYKTFISGLLDITDNLDGETIVPPDRVVRHDGPDPYLVVAADKGTASFSDIANEISVARGFWLGDAFASGGSNGYDHKKMGITAKGAWESVKRHFRELGLDTQSQRFSVVGIGDMAGDVFGNGMLLSPHIQLKAAFNHRHIFLDPHPDCHASFKERQRLFNLLGSSWADYNEKLMSKGGGIFSRQAKTIEVSLDVQEWLGLEEKTLTPQALIQALLRSPVDLLWNGGIGTYVKASAETHADVGDLANNQVRINGNELRARVVGEGGNLGLTQRGRIEYALAGGMINTDFIDNSAGVDCSDHEVNIKILLNHAVEASRLSVEQRNALLEKMTEEVSALVLRSNTLQTQAISVMSSMTGDRLGSEAHFIAMLEGQGVIDRDLENLPDEEALKDRVTRGLGLTRPELSLLLSFSKITLYQDLLDSDVPEDPYLSRELEAYFPKPLQKGFRDLMPEHRLRREIVATRVTNSIVNRMGAHFATRIKEDTGADSATMAKAFTVAREILSARPFWEAIESLDNVVPAACQTAALLEMWKLMRHVTRRLIALRNGYQIDISSQVKRFGSGVAEYANCLVNVLPAEQRAELESRQLALVESGMPEALAFQVARLPLMHSALDIVDESLAQGSEVEQVAQIYFELLGHLHLKWLRASVENLPVEQAWHAHARGHLREQLFQHHRQLTMRVLKEQGRSADAIKAWFATYAAEVSRVCLMLDEMVQSNAVDYPSLQVAIAGVEQLLNATAKT